MSQSLVVKTFSQVQRGVSSINPFRILRKQDISEMLAKIESLEESLSSASIGHWVTAAELNLSGDGRWKKIREQAMAGWAADGVVKRIHDKYIEWALAGGVRYSTNSDAGWVDATIKRLWPDGFFQFFTDYLFYFTIMGELYFLPKFNGIRQLVGYELISPLEVLNVYKDAATGKIFFNRMWQETNVVKSSGGETLDVTFNNKRQAYSSDEVFIIKWNSSANRGLPFVHPIVHWVMVYNEWLKDRAITNRMRSYAFLKRKLNAHAGVAKVKADQFASQQMKTTSYVPGRSDQYGFGYKVEKMPTGGILTEDADTEWDTISFNIQGDDASPDGHAFRQQVCALTGIPEALLFNDDKSKLDAADSRVESLVRKIEYYREMFTGHINAILQHCRNVELVQSNRLEVSLAGRRVNTRVHLHFKPAAVGERRFVTEDLNKAMVGGQISRRTAMEISPFVTDPEVEEERIKAEYGDEMNTEFLDRLGTAKSNRDDEDTDNKKKSKDEDAGTRSKKRVIKKKGAGEK